MQVRSLHYVASACAVLFTSLAVADVGVAGNLMMSDSSDSANGNVLKDGTLFLHNFGSGNTFLGANAGNLTMSGHDNAAFGNIALGRNTEGFNNVAIGASAMVENTRGSYNTATGDQSLRLNTTGSQNTAVGAQALVNNIVGDGNTASGIWSLFSNSTGFFNTAIGHSALYSGNGNWNTAIGFGALANQTFGDDNIAIGFRAGHNLLNGFGNIYIGNPGTILAESNTIRIGRPEEHSRFFAAGVRDATGFSSGVPVLIGVDGQLGVAASSRRFKEDIRDMGKATGQLRKLRPVTFYYKQDKQAQARGPRQLQYGLIAEEVEAVYPELVEYSESGQPFTVRYQLLAPMLLNEVQRQEREIELQRRQILEQAAQMTKQAAQIAELQAQAARIAALQSELAAISTDLKRLNRQETTAVAVLASGR